MHVYAYKHISTATTTTIKEIAGLLHGVTINTTAAGTVTIYDGPVANNKVIAILKASIAEGTLIYDVAFADGLVVVTAGASDITVSYK